MRHTSIRLLIVAVVLTLVAAVGYYGWKETSAPPMSPAVAQSLLDRGKRALEQRDVSGIMALFTDDARIVGQSPDKIRSILEQTMRELGSRSLTVSMSRIEAQPTPEGAAVSVSLDVMQHFTKADASYFRPRVRLVLKKQRVSRFLGLGWQEEWRIKQLDSDIPLDVSNI